MFRGLKTPLPLGPKFPKLSCPVLKISTQLAFMTCSPAGRLVSAHSNAAAGAAASAVEELAVLNTFHFQLSSVLFTSLLSGLGKFCLHPLAKPHPYFKRLQILTSKSRARLTHLAPITRAGPFQGLCDLALFTSAQLELVRLCG